MRIVALLVILAALGSGGWYGYYTWISPPPEVKYTTAEVAQGALVNSVSATGTVEPVLKVLVGSQVSGTVVRWYTDFNQTVKKDDILAELDQDRFQAVLDQRIAAVAVAKARVEEAAARLSTAALEKKRTQQAFERSAASEFEMESVKANEAAAAAALHAAQAQLQAAEADQRLAAADLEKTIIRSPIDGVVISRDIDAGQTVAASLQAPTLFNIANDLAQMQVNAAVNETDIGKVREGMTARFRVDAYPERRFNGTVSQVRYAQTVVDNVVTYMTLIDVDNPDLLLRPGMTATILFEVAKVEDVLYVPNAALRFDPEAQAEQTDWWRPGRGRAVQPRVFVLEEQNRLREVPVELGLSDGASTEVRSPDLKAGDQVVTMQEIRGARPAAATPGGSGPRRGPRM